MKENTKKMGKVALVGRPNVGKSTILNALLKHKVAITSPKPQTTRSQIIAFLEDERGQMFFLDTPGYYNSRGRATSFNAIVSQSINEADVVVYVVDKTRDWGREDQMVWQKVQEADKPTVVVLNKTDEAGPDYTRNYRDLLEDEVNQFIEVSALKGTNLNLIVEAAFEYLPEGKRDDMVDDFPTPLISLSSKEYVAELIREKIYNHTGQEIPYVTSVRVNDIETESEDHTRIEAEVLVPEDRYKAILIGKNGRKIKQIGMAVRRELELATDRHFTLKLEVVKE